MTIRECRGEHPRTFEITNSSLVDLFLEAALVAKNEELNYLLSINVGMNDDDDFTLTVIGD